MRADTNTLDKDYFQKSLHSPKENLMGWMCTYTPVELIHAAGFTPYRIYGLQQFNNADGYLPINFCPYLKSSFEQLLKEKDTLKGMIFANSCDGSRRLMDITTVYLEQMPSYIMDVPRLVSKLSLDFYSLSLKKLLFFLENLKGEKISEKSILESVNLFKKIKKSLQSLKNAYLDGQISLIDYYRVVKLSTISEPSAYENEIKKFLEILPSLKKLPPNGTSLMVVGNFINEERLLKILSGLDCHIIFDDLCTTHRYFAKNTTYNEKDIMHGLAESYLTSTACMRMADMSAKLEHIKKIIGKKKAEAIIFVSLKFCDNTLYFYPLLKKRLEVPILNLELEYNNFSEGQVKTRLEAFLEMLC